jgi:NADPH-dependent 7-cyano-7-deazaguanine reductase QueF
MIPYALAPSNIPQPAAAAGLRDRYPLSRVHLGVSLKYYLMEFRNQGIFYEAVTNKILDDLVAVCQPRRMTVTGAFTARGGITTTVAAEYVKTA